MKNISLIEKADDKAKAFYHNLLKLEGLEDAGSGYNDTSSFGTGYLWDFILKDVSKNGFNEPAIIYFRYNPNNDTYDCGLECESYIIVSKSSYYTTELNEKQVLELLDSIYDLGIYKTMQIYGLNPEYKKQI